MIDGVVCYWVTGHSMGAGVANLVAASLISSEAIQDIRALEGNSDNVYCYTYASPNTFYKTDNRYIRDSHAIPGKYVTGDYREPKGVKYRCIFNIVNDDDFVPKLPMEECEWTRYGRVGNKSVKIEYLRNYEKLNIRTTLSAGYNPITTNYTLYYFLTTYKGNPGVPTSIAKGFAEIFDNKSQMRYETYSNEEFINILKQKGTNVNGGMPVYTLPYQKLVKIGEENVQKGDIVYTKEIYRQEQKPAFVFQLVANARHEYVINRNNNQKEKDPLWNKTVLLATPLPGKYSKAVNKLVIDNDPLRLNYIYLESPHCLESYYSLTKIINTIDFQ